MLDRLTLDHLRTLVAVAGRRQLFRRRARRLSRVQSAVSQSIRGLEQTLDLTLFDRTGQDPDTDGCRPRRMLDDARRLIAQAQALQARAERIASDIEPELTLAVDVMFPNKLLMNSLKTLTQDISRSARDRLHRRPGRRGTAVTRWRGAPWDLLFVPAQTGAEDLVTAFFADTIAMALPVVAADHPLARAKGPLDRATLEEHVRAGAHRPHAKSPRASAAALSAGVCGDLPDLGTRLEYLRAGFGWCEHAAASGPSRHRCRTSGNACG